MMVHLKPLLWLGILLLNIAGLILVAADKAKARRHRLKRSAFLRNRNPIPRRISEKTFFGLALLGGSIGVYSGCLLWRHKTKHNRFMVGLPILIILQVLLTYYLHLF